MEASELRRVKELEEKNARLKRMYANLAMELDVAKYIIEKKFKPIVSPNENSPILYILR